MQLPANSDALGNAGRVFKLKARGLITTAASAPGTLALKVLIGATILATGTSVTLPTSLTNGGWTLEGELTVATTGTSGKVAFNGEFKINNSASAPIIVDLLNPTIGTLTGTSNQITVNTQAAQNIIIQETMSANVNTITLMQLIVEEISA